MTGGDIDRPGKPARGNGGRPRLILASASPARLSLLRSAGIEPDVVVSGVDETAVTEQDPTRLTELLATAKAQAAAAGLPTDPPGVESLVLGCDSVLDIDGTALGRPRDVDDARERWARMAGSRGVLRTGHCLICTATGRQLTEVSSTEVRFGVPTEPELAAYLRSGEPLRVAGAFTIDALGAAFVEAIHGDHGTVVGVSLPTLRRLLAGHGVLFTDLWVPDRAP